MRCAVCGSKRVIEEVKNEGFNHKKGALGVALIGQLGALMGLSGNKVTYYHCAECGQVLNKCMNELEAREIDQAINDKDNPIFMEELLKYKEKYINLEISQEYETQAQKYIRSRKNICDEDVLTDLKKYINQLGIISIGEMYEYMKKIGYAENVVNQIPYKLSHSSNHNIKFIYEEDICKMTTDTSIDFPTIQRENERIYNIAFKSEIESRAQKINAINELGTSICDYIYSKSPNPVSMTELLERFPTFSRQQISSSIMHSGSIVKKADKGIHYFEIDQNKYNIAQPKKDIQQKHNNMIKKKNTKANVYTAIDTDQFLAKINSQLPKIDTREEKADFLTLKSFYQNCDFSKKNENIQKKDYIYAIYLILKANEFKDVAYDKIFKLYSLLSKNEMSEEENKILTKYLVDSFRNDIDIIRNISLTHFTRISNNTQKDFVNIEDFIEHETMIVYKKKM